MNRFLGVLSNEKVELLLCGLASLESSLTAMKQPIPPALNELKRDLRKNQEDLQERTEQVLTTKEAAQILMCSVRHVRHLAKIGRITLLERGEVGRGRSNRYDEQSVYDYRAERQKREVEK